MLYLRLSGTESNDISIVFKDNSPRSTANIVHDLNLRIAALRDLYKCQSQNVQIQQSDNFILFTEDFEDCNHQYLLYYR